MAITKEDLKELADSIENAKAFTATTFDDEGNAGVYIHGKGDNLLALTCALIESLAEKFNINVVELLLLILKLMHNKEKNNED
jgi:hypothetical protein